MQTCLEGIVLTSGVYCEVLKKGDQTGRGTPMW